MLGRTEPRKLDLRGVWTAITYNLKKLNQKYDFLVLLIENSNVRNLVFNLIFIKFYNFPRRSGEITNRHIYVKLLYM